MLMMNPGEASGNLPSFFWSSEIQNVSSSLRRELPRESRPPPPSSKHQPPTLWSNEPLNMDYTNSYTRSEKFRSREIGVLHGHRADLDHMDNYPVRQEKPTSFETPTHTERRFGEINLDFIGSHYFPEKPSSLATAVFSGHRLVSADMDYRDNFLRHDNAVQSSRHTVQSDSFSNPSVRIMELNSESKMGFPKMEQMSLQNQLYVAYHSQNVKDTVSLLRKIYTKQYKGFRIPSVLKNIRRDQKPDELILADLLFTLECIQWCFGGQKTYEPESFTYKMNCYVAQCLLEDAQKRNIPSFLSNDAIQMAVITAQSILKQVPELELALEILEWVGVPDPGSVMISYLNIWNKSMNPAVVFRARRFAREYSKLAMPIPRVFSPPTAGPDLTVVRERLFHLLSRFPSGVLGARIPELYLTEYHEPMDLHRQKLKDILLGLHNVKMTSVRGSGDKIFSIIGIRETPFNSAPSVPSVTSVGSPVMHHYPDMLVERDDEYKQFLQMF